MPRLVRILDAVHGVLIHLALSLVEDATVTAIVATSTTVVKTFQVQQLISVVSNFKSICIAHITGLTSLNFYYRPRSAIKGQRTDQAGERT